METLPALITATHDTSLTNNKRGANKFIRLACHWLWVFRSILPSANSLIFCIYAMSHACRDCSTVLKIKDYNTLLYKKIMVTVAASLCRFQLFIIQPILLLTSTPCCMEDNLEADRYCAGVHFIKIIICISKV